MIFSVASHEPRQLSLIVNIDVDIVVDVIASGKLGSELCIDNPDNVMSVDALHGSPVSSAIEVALISPGQLLLEEVHMSLGDWIDCGQDVPVDVLVARRGCQGALVDVSVLCVNHVH